MSCATHVRKTERKSVFPFCPGFRRVTDGRRRRSCEMHISRWSRLQPLQPLAARRGICRRKFPVAKIHDLYIGIGHQRLSGLIAFRRRVEAFVSDNLRLRATAQRI